VAWFKQTLDVSVLKKVLVSSDRAFLSGSCVDTIVVVIKARRPRSREILRTYRNGNELPGYGMEHTTHLAENQYVRSLFIYLHSSLSRMIILPAG